MLAVPFAANQLKTRMPEPRKSYCRWRSSSPAWALEVLNADIAAHHVQERCIALMFYHKVRHVRTRGRSAQVPGDASDADALAAAPDNRELLHDLVTETAETPQLGLSAFDDRGMTFVAGSLTYSENLHDFIVFLAMARGIADHLAPDGHGLAIVHNYLWGSTVTAALRMMPSGDSHILPESKWHNVVPAFQPIADALAEDRLSDGFSVREQLRLLG